MYLNTRTQRGLFAGVRTGTLVGAVSRWNPEPHSTERGVSCVELAGFD
jgi:hypothetical protein